MSLKKLSIKKKLVVTFVLIGTLPLLISNFFSYIEISSEVETLAAEKAKILAHNKAQAISTYFKSEINSLIDLADSPLTTTALEELSLAMEEPNGDWVQKHRPEILRFYQDVFGKMYEEKTKQEALSPQLVSQLDPVALLGQFDFIVANEHPLGQKDQLEAPQRDSAYSRAHLLFHRFFKNYLGRHGLYDLFLVNQNGRVVYSVFKETDFATSLKNGPWAKTGLAKAFEEARKLEGGRVHIEDFAHYTPSYESPASFASTPLLKDGKFQGALIIQFPLDKISLVAGLRDGMGELGETLLIGSDSKLRADTFRNQKTHTVESSFSSHSEVSVHSGAVDRAQSGEEGFVKNISYDGLPTLAYFLPLQIENLTWYMVVELSQKEVYSGLRKIIFYSLTVLLLGSALILFIAFLYGDSIAQNLTSIARTLNRTSEEVSSASSHSATSATELSEASLQQAASLQETMASVEQISAMVSQNADSAAKTLNAVNANQRVSQEGSQSIDDMLNAINEIKRTNDEILSQMENSTREFAEIVRVIGDIGQKTQVINDIVFQTKLLSFNASVEAARAGEHGKGFAVVAEEVGNLAQMSGHAAKQINEMLSDSIEKVNTIVARTKTKVDQLIEVGKNKISVGEATAENCRRALNQITENAQSMGLMMSEIAQASKEQALGIQEISKAIHQLDQATQQNTSVAQQSSSQAEQLHAEAAALSEAVEKLLLFVEGLQEQRHPSPPIHQNAS